MLVIIGETSEFGIGENMSCTYFLFGRKGFFENLSEFGIGENMPCTSNMNQLVLR